MTTRRTFVKSLAAGTIGAAMLQPSVQSLFAETKAVVKPLTNAGDLVRYPRTEH